MELEIDNVVELSLLYDFYGALLKENKRKIFEDYILNDYSLSEIAEYAGMTRQGVYDTVKRSSNQLREYEKNLLLVNRFQEIKKLVNKIEETAKQIAASGNVDDIHGIIDLSGKILDEL